MGIRRRRRKLSTLVGRLDQRVRSVELRSTNLLTAAQVAAVVEQGETTTTPETIVSSSAPWQWTRIQDAYYYPKKLASNDEDRVEIYLEADLDNLARGERLAVSGMHGTSNFDIDITSDNFTVLHLDAVDEGGVWTNRASWKHDPTQDQLSGVTITNTYSFKPETVGPATWTTRQRLQTRREVDSFEITGTTVTLTMNAAHKFQVGDIFYTNILSDQASNDESRIASGIDGLFYVTAKTNTTIEYELTAGVDTPTGTINPTADVYVWPVARHWAQYGSTWINSSNNTTYYWNNLRWVEYTPDATITADDDPPSAPTNLTIESDIIYPKDVVELSVSWSAPTTNESGSSLTDLAGHNIYWRIAVTEQWNSHFVPIGLGNNYTFNGKEFDQEETYYFEVKAEDTGGNESAALTGTHTTAGSASQSNIQAVRPTPPDVDTYLGTFTITWDGDVEDTSNVIQSDPPAVAFLYVHASTSSTFSPSDSSRVATLAAGPNQKYVYAPTDYTSTYYFALEIEDRAHNTSLYSRIISATGQSNFDAERLADMIAAANIVPGTVVSGETIVGLNIAGEFIIGDEINGNLITANSINAIHIDAGSITSKLSQGDVITTSPTDSGSRIRLTKDYLEAYNNTTLTFRVTAANGHVYIGDSVQIGGDYVTTSDLSGYATTGQLNGKIDTGGAAADVNNGSTTINGNSITTGTIDADLLVSDMVLSSLIKLQDSDANLGRIELRGSGSNRGIVAFKNSGGGTANATFRLYTANGVAYLKDTYIDGDVTISGGQIVAGSTTISSGFITGGVLRTSSSGQRVEMRDSTNSLRFYNSGGSVAGEIEGTSLGARFDSALGAFMNVGGGVSMGSGGTTATSVSSSGLVLLVAPTTTFSANLRRPDAGNVIQVVSSDVRIKENVFTITDGINVVSQLNPVTFNSRVDDTDKLVSGFLAQDVANIFPSNSYTVVTEVEGTIPPLEDVESLDFENNPLLSLNHIELIPYLTKAIQELTQKNSELEARIATLEGN